MSTELHPALDTLVQRWEKAGQTDLKDLMGKLTAGGFYPEEILDYILQHMKVGVSALIHHLAGQGMPMRELTDLLRQGAQWTDTEILEFWHSLSDQGVLQGSTSPSTAPAAGAPATTQPATGLASAAEGQASPVQPGTNQQQGTTGPAGQQPLAAPAHVKVQVSGGQPVLNRKVRKEAMKTLLQAPQTHGLHIGGFNLSDASMELHIAQSIHDDITGPATQLLEHMEASLHTKFPKLKDALPGGKLFDGNTLEAHPKSTAA